MSDTLTPDPTALIAEALARRGLSSGTALKLTEATTYQPLTIRWSCESVAIDPPGCCDNPTDAWVIRVPVEVVVHDADDLDAAYDDVVAPLRGLGFELVGEERSGPDPDDGTSAMISDWVIQVDTADEVASIIERLMEMALSSYPENDDWETVTVPLSADQVVALVGMGVPVEDETGNVTRCPVLPPRGTWGWVRPPSPAAPHRLAGPDGRCVATVYATLAWVIWDLDRPGETLHEGQCSSLVDARRVVEALVGAEVVHA